MLPVIFVMVCQNYDKAGYRGFEVSSEAYSAYPGEREVLFSEDCLVRIIEVHENATLRTN